MSLSPEWTQKNRREIDDLFSSLRVARGLRRPRPEWAPVEDVRAAQRGLAELQQEVARLREELSGLSVELAGDKKRRDEELARLFAERDARDANLTVERERRDEGLAAELKALRADFRDALALVKPAPPPPPPQPDPETRAVLSELASAVARLGEDLQSLRKARAEPSVPAVVLPPAPAPAPAPVKPVVRRKAGEEFDAMRAFADGDAA